MNYYIGRVWEMMEKSWPLQVNEKLFLEIMGGIFLLGFLTKWMVSASYNSMLRKAGDMSNPRNATLRRIKTKYESIMQLNSRVSNPVFLVKQHLNSCRVLGLPLNRLNGVINFCTVLTIAVSGATGWMLYSTGENKTTAMAYIMTGCFFAFALDMIDRSIQIKERKEELAYVIAEALESSVNGRRNRQTEMVGEGKSFIQQDMTGLKDDMRQSENTVPQNREGLSEEQKHEEREEKILDEQILNQVIGEFLQ